MAPPRWSIIDARQTDNIHVLAFMCKLDLTFWNVVQVYLPKRPEMFNHFGRCMASMMMMVVFYHLYFERCLCSFRFGYAIAKLDFSKFVNCSKMATDRVVSLWEVWRKTERKLCGINGEKSANDSCSRAIGIGFHCDTICLYLWWCGGHCLLGPSN